MPNRKKIAVLFCGGKMSSIRKKNGSIEKIERLEDVLSIMPDINKNFDITAVFNLVEKKYFLSQNDYLKISEYIKNYSQEFDGFVVIQETDTMLFGSSLIAFLNSQFFKPIIFSCSPTSFNCFSSSIAEENFRGAIEFAGSDIGEVAIFSHGLLTRAVRTERRSMDKPSPFYSFGIEDLGKIEENNLSLNLHRVRRNDYIKDYPYQFPKNIRVPIIRITPNMDLSVFNHLTIRSEVKAIIVQSMGYGSIPDNVKNELEQIHYSGISVLILAEYDSLVRKFSLTADTLENFLVIKNIGLWTLLAKAHIGVKNTNTRGDFYDFILNNISQAMINYD